MSQTRVVFDGLEELKRDLRNLPQTLTDEARGIVEHAAKTAASDVRASYPRVHGNLIKGVRVSTSEPNRFSAAATVKNTAPHAWIYDNGSNARHYYTKSGKKHETGAMWGRHPATHLFVRASIRARREMYGRLKAMLTAQGLEVSGDA
jgi:hypothetical protein